MNISSKSEKITGRVVAIDDVGAHIRVLQIALPNDRRLDFKAGQYAELGFAGYDPRPYSIASSPESGNLEFHIRAIGAGRASDYATTQIHLGEEVVVEGPFGGGFLKNLDRPLLAIAGGLGIAPMKAIVESALTQGMKQPIALYHGTRQADDLYLLSHFRTLTQSHGNLQFVPVVSGIEDGWSGRTGPVVKAVTEDFEDLSAHQAFLAGPTEMVAQSVDFLLEKGLKPENIFGDAVKRVLKN